jgi:hypothetical protein
VGKTVTGLGRARRLGLAGAAAAAFWLVAWVVWLNVQAHAYATHIHDRGALPSTSSPSSSSHVDPRLSRIASAVAGREVEVRCWSVSDWYRIDAERAEVDHDPERLGLRAAFVSYDRKRINLGTVVCADLARGLGGVHAGEESRWDLVWAIGLLAHESMHVRGIGSESRAECLGIQEIPQVVRLLGLSAGEGRRVAHSYWTGWYPLRDPKYRSSECRDGGELDQRPESPVWP